MGAPQPLVSRHAHQGDAPRPQHAIELANCRHISFVEYVLEDVEAGNQIEGGIRKGQVRNRAARQLLMSPPAAEIEGGCRQVDAGDLMTAGVLRQPRQHPAGAAAGVEHLSITAARQQRIEQTFGDVAHADKPPKVFFQFVEIRVVVRLHRSAE